MRAVVFFVITMGVSTALMAQPELDRNHAKNLLAPMGEALPWLTTNPRQ